MPLTRRSLLAALAGVLATGSAGCTVFGSEPAQPAARASPPPPDPLLPLLATENALLARYDAALARYPHLGERIGPVRADHAAHLSALRALVRNPGARPSAPATPSPAPTPIVAPSTAAAALAALRSAEMAGATLLTSACLAAPPARAAVLGSIAACESAHLVLLR